MSTAEPVTQQVLPFPDLPPGGSGHRDELDSPGTDRDYPPVPGLLAAAEIALADPAAPDWLGGADLVVVDIETTGWLADAAVITEIGAVRLHLSQLGKHGGRGGHSQDWPGEHSQDWPGAGRGGAEFSALVNPDIPIPAVITDLTGITDVMVAGAPPIGEVLPGFLDFAAGAVLVAHNAPFDIGFLTSACAACGISWPPFQVVDTATLSRLILGPGDVPDHKLATLAGYFETSAGPCHRALDDARATAGVLAGLLGLLAAR